MARFLDPVPIDVGNLDASGANDGDVPIVSSGVAAWTAPASGGAFTKTTVTGIDAKSATTTTLYTNSTGNAVMIAGVVLRCTAATAITVPATAGVGVAAGEDDIFYPQKMFGVVAQHDTWTFWAQAKAVLVQNSEVVKLGIDTAATGTSQTLAADIFTYEVA